MFPTRSDYFRAGRDEILAQNAALSADIVDRDGTDANILLAAGSAMADKATGQLIIVAAGLFLDSSEDVALDRYVFDRYGLVRKPAAPSFGYVNFTTTAPVPSSFAIPVGTVLSTADGVQFVTVVASSMLAGSTGPVFVQVRSILAGFNQQQKIGTITSVVSEIPGQPNDLAVTNNAATAGASDREGDDALKDRARRFWTTAQRGTLSAIETGALAVPGVLRASALEILDGNARPGRWVVCVVSDRFTDALSQLNQTTVTYQAQSQALAATVFNALNEYRCGGIFVQVIVAQVLLLQVGLSLTFSAGVDTIQVANQARGAIAGYINELNPGDSFFPATALQRLRQVAGLVITGNEITTPAGVVVPRVLQVLRTQAELIDALNGDFPLASNIDPDAFIDL